MVQEISKMIKLEYCENFYKQMGHMQPVGRQFDMSNLE